MNERRCFFLLLMGRFSVDGRDMACFKKMGPFKRKVAFSIHHHDTSMDFYRFRDRQKSIFLIQMHWTSGASDLPKSVRSPEIRGM